MLSSVDGGTTVGYVGYNITDISGTAAGTAAVSLENTLQAYTGTSSFRDSFGCAIELESISNRSDILLCGVNTIAQNFFCYLNVDTPAPPASYTLGFYAVFDCILII